MANIGYIRVSSEQQNTGRQFELLKDRGINLDKIFEEKVSGKDTKNRPQLQAMLNYVREGDTVYVESISRLARNTQDLLKIVAQLQEKDVAFTSLKESFDTSTPTGKFVLTMFAALAELERSTIKERQREGIDLCLKEKRPYGRHKIKISSTFGKNYKKWKAGQFTAVEFMRLEGLKKSTFYTLVKEYEKSNDI